MKCVQTTRIITLGAVQVCVFEAGDDKNDDERGGDNDDDDDSDNDHDDSGN